ncbi:MAG: CHASE2 domain-containing protein [Candidatus Xenobia bacterium]
MGPQDLSSSRARLLRRGVLLAVALLVGLSAFLVDAGRVLEGWEDHTDDLRVAALRLMHPRPPRDVVMVAVDQATLESTRASWPWSAHLVARLLSRTLDTGAVAVGVWLPFDRIGQVDPASNGELIDLLANHPAIVVAGAVQPRLTLPPFSRAHAGFASIVPDHDGVLRSFVMSYDIQSQLYDSLPLEMYRVACHNADGWPSQMPVRRNQAFPIDWCGPPGTIPCISAHRVLSGLDRPDLAGKMVVLGERLQGDPKFDTPFDTPPYNQPRMEFLEALANAVASVPPRSGLTRLAPGPRALLLIGLPALAVLLFATTGAAVGLAVLIFMSFLYAAAATAATLYASLLMPVTVPLCSLLTAWLCGSLTARLLR